MKIPRYIGFVGACTAAVLSLACRDAPSSSGEVRGVWLTNVDSHVLESREGIARAMQFLSVHHFNVVFPVVWNKGYTLYRSATMDSLFGLPIDPVYGNRDPLAELIEEAHARGIAVIPWFEFGFSSAHEKGPQHILQHKPGWAARDREGNILTKNGFQWMNAFHPEVRDFLESLVLEVIRDYDIDGIQGDDRLPAQPVEGGYSAFTDRLYKDEHGGIPPPDNDRDPSWVRWRAELLSAFARELAGKAKALKPEIVISWAPSVFPWSYEEYLQDWPAWINDGDADLVIPQVYRYSFEEYRQTLESQHPDSLGIVRTRCVIVPGLLLNLADYLMSESYLDDALALNRRLGYRGEVFFFYEGLRKNNDRVATFLATTYYTQSVPLPFRTRFSPKSSSSDNEEEEPSP